MSDDHGIVGEDAPVDGAGTTSGAPDGGDGHAAEAAPARADGGSALAPTTSTAGGRSRPREGDLMSAPGEGPGAPLPGDAGDAALLGLVDRLASILERGDLAELEVSAGDTTIIVRSPAAIERATALVAAEPSAAVAGPAPAAAPAAASPAAPPAKPSVKAPLTGIFYGSPSPGATPYVAVGDHVAVGQIIGLIEAMKLFNEIKSDLAGRVVRICADNGQLVKAKAPLIEVEPA